MLSMAFIRKHLRRRWAGGNQKSACCCPQRLSAKPFTNRHCQSMGILLLFLFILCFCHTFTDILCSSCAFICLYSTAQCCHTFSEPPSLLYKPKAALKAFSNWCKLLIWPVCSDFATECSSALPQQRLGGCRAQGCRVVKE